MKYAGLLLFFVGISFLGLSYYIHGRVHSETKSAYEATSKLSDNPLTEMGGTEAKNASKEIESLANSRIDKKAKPYEQMATYAHNLGLILIALGVIVSLIFIIRKLF